ncbi:hypothetical protein DYB38_009572 [Aphanomyces astaci]|uniref:Uncharacterized protein n=1 Tax=Aphanomyces astaci TaxID=112090 RepID=A0A397C050_APHAT|nr:hypothetical protein DYB38_009572 [Aphanomyces astaci]
MLWLAPVCGVREPVNVKPRWRAGVLRFDDIHTLTIMHDDDDAKTMVRNIRGAYQLATDGSEMVETIGQRNNAHTLI